MTDRMLRAITLPDAGEIIQRLVRDFESPELQRDFYPSLARELGGKSLNALGINDIIQAAIKNFLERGYAGVWVGIIQRQGLLMIDALIDDGEVALATKAAYREAQGL